LIIVTAGRQSATGLKNGMERASQEDPRNAGYVALAVDYVYCSARASQGSRGC